MTGDDHVRVLTDNVLWRDLDDQIVLLDLRTSSYLRLNQTGASLWPLLVEGCSRSALVDVLVREHGRPRSAAAADVDAFLEDLQSKRLLDD